MKELKEFTVERLEEIIEWTEVFGRHPKLDECTSLAKIALAAKKAKPVVWRRRRVESKEWKYLDREFGSGEFMEEQSMYTTPPLNHTEQHMVVPDGWKLVPIEPDYEMKKHYHDASVAPISKLSVTGYRAMLAAAPKPESE